MSGDPDISFVSIQWHRMQGLSCPSLAPGGCTLHWHTAPSLGFIGKRNCASDICYSSSLLLLTGFLLQDSTVAVRSPRPPRPRDQLSRCPVVSMDRSQSPTFQPPSAKKTAHREPENYGYLVGVAHGQNTTNIQPRCRRRCCKIPHVATPHGPRLGGRPVLGLECRLV